MLDAEAFVSWLGERGVPAEHWPLYRQEVAALQAVAGDGAILPKHLDQLMAQREAAGATPRQLANLKKVGDAIVQFERERPSAPPPAVLPAVSALPAQPAATPASRPELPPPPRGYTVQKAGVFGGLIAVIAGVFGSFAGRTLVRTGCSGMFGPKGVSVEGQFHSPTVDVTIDFPSGWKHLPKEDQSESNQGIPVHISMFYKGGSSNDPDVGLFLGATPEVEAFSKMDEMDDERLLQMTEQSARSGGANAAKLGGSWTKESCEVIAWSGRAGRCKGVMSKGSERWDALMYVMVANKRLAFALFMSKKYDSGVQSEIDGMVSTLSL
jgi:hypothetical protein